MNRVCIIGAGSSGIASCQVLNSRGISFDCFEAGSGVGGNWRYMNDNGMSSAYRSLHINSSRQSMEYATFPMPDHLPPYVNHEQAAQYFDDYVDHFGFRESIQFRTEVTRVEKGPAGSWNVTTRHRDTGEELTGRYDAVLVANGHHWNPRMPDPAFPGADTFKGTQLHSHDYRTPDLLAGKRVVVLGIGNSASDIAVEGSQVAERMFLAMRRGVHIVPKFVFGVPVDHLTLSWASVVLPLRAQQLILGTALRLARGRPTRYGLQKPDHRILAAHPTASDSLLSKLGHGDLTVKPNIVRLDHDKVHFADGSVEEVDVVVYATGYKISFPFFDSDLVDAEDNWISLYRRVVPPQHPGLYFIGLVQPIGAIMPLAEAQSEWVADLLEGRARLPGYAAMAKEIDTYQSSVARRYVKSDRHTIQVDFRKYLRELRKERQEGARRPGISRALPTGVRRSNPIDVSG
ncbi:NAD(P)-binding domain-containing protein [Streptomyces sp. ME19-01-6]|uniref:NAD(P)-binding domain-containing protein n=1 Tax=Streptomyces sp. ME19-01-6 TaxID=3028686 RepID=UPI0029B214EB|nr:NAD(P)-binding domain-containing protein [Streptomyces sp. ME19-01-6]MDX3224998.1 NAD(P)-binding domain-containing protein [Streptomyces sp. ME19-01-6]